MVSRPKLAFVVLLAVFAASAGVRAADLPEQRLACQEEARRSIKGPSRIDPDLYRRVVDRRQLFVRDCMALGPQNIEQTGSVGVPLPPKRPSVGDIQGGIG